MIPLSSHLLLHFLSVLNKFPFTLNALVWGGLEGGLLERCITFRRRQ